VRSGSPFAWLLGIVVRPRPTFLKVNRRAGASWWLPLLLAVVMVILPIVVAGPILTRKARDAISESQKEMAEQRGVEISADQQEQIEAVAASPFLILVFPAVGGVLSQVVGWLVWAGALYLAGIALGGRSPFGAIFRVVAWSSLPYSLRGLLQTTYIVATGEIIAHPGLSGFAGESTLLVSFLSSIDLFLIWRLVLVGIGVSTVTHLSRSKSATVTLGVWALFTSFGLVFAYVGTIVGQQFGGM